jgi:hypothetical protein
MQKLEKFVKENNQKQKQNILGCVPSISKRVP